ncbi:hypothetical protein ACFE04_016705 [Oxalis oulophora]
MGAFQSSNLNREGSRVSVPDGDGSVKHFLEQSETEKVIQESQVLGDPSLKNKVGSATLDVINPSRMRIVDSGENLCGLEGCNQLERNKKVSILEKEDGLNGLEANERPLSPTRGVVVTSEAGGISIGPGGFKRKLCLREGEETSQEAGNESIANRTRTRNLKVEARRKGVGTTRHNESAVGVMDQGDETNVVEAESKFFIQYLADYANSELSEYKLQATLSHFKKIVYMTQPSLSGLTGFERSKVK